MPEPASYIAIVFIATVLLTFFLFVKASANNRVTALLSTVWLLITGTLSYRGFYTDTTTIPPKLVFAVIPVLLLIVLLFLTPKGRTYIDGLNIKTLTLLSIVRVPVEVVLYWLFLNKAVPGLMTFAGRNFDIIAGITAPLMWIFCFKAGHVSHKKLLLAWNFICLALLLNIVINAILAIPTRFQQFGFDQPNIAVLYFPFTWLPAFVVPVVLFSHLAAIRKLTKSSDSPGRVN